MESNDAVSSVWDTHCHLQSNRYPAPGPVIARALAAGIGHMVCCGTCERDWAAVKALADAYPDAIVPAYGIHPWFLTDRSAGWLETLRGYLADPRAVIGEIGLDHAPDTVTGHDEQLDVFGRQLQLAYDLNRPVSIHCRRAWEALTEAFRGRRPLPRGGVLHSFAGSTHAVQEFAGLNMYFSYSCSLANPANKRSARSLAAVPPDRLLTETDSPDIRPNGWDGPNEPVNVRTVLAAMAEKLGRPEADIARQTAMNARRVFFNEG